MSRQRLRHSLSGLTRWRSKPASPLQRTGRTWTARPSTWSPFAQRGDGRWRWWLRNAAAGSMTSVRGFSRCWCHPAAVIKSPARIPLSSDIGRNGRLLVRFVGLWQNRELSHRIPTSADSVNPGDRWWAWQCQPAIGRRQADGGTAPTATGRWAGKPAAPPRHSTGLPMRAGSGTRGHLRLQTFGQP